MRNEEQKKEKKKEMKTYFYRQKKEKMTMNAGRGSTLEYEKLVDGIGMRQHARFMHDGMNETNTDGMEYNSTRSRTTLL